MFPILSLDKTKEIGIYTHHELVFSFQNVISPERLDLFPITKSKFLATHAIQSLKPLRDGYIQKTFDLIPNILKLQVQPIPLQVDRESTFRNLTPAPHIIL